LKYDLDDIELEFENAVRLYRSPVRSALTDIRILYHAENNVSGDFSGFNNVSVYVHGIEDTGTDFFGSVKSAAQNRDIIVRVKRDGTTVYYTVKVEKGVKEISEELDYNALSKTDIFKMKSGRVHMVYDTDHENEHRQETSDDLAQLLNKMGLMSEQTKVDMFAHSYGGRRSLQFAMDYPDNVRSITTVGTPYDTNFLATAANNVRWVAELAGKDPKNTSDYLDFNVNNRNNKDGMDYSNAYTDMTSEPLSDDIRKLKAANPEIYRKLEEMDITAVAGYRTEYTINYSPYYYSPPQEYKTNSDDTVSVESQNAEILGDLIDNRPQIEVKGKNTFDPGHVYEVTDSDFIAIIKETNIYQKE